MATRQKPLGQRTEQTSPALVALGALVAIGLFALAFSFWPDSTDLRTSSVSNTPQTTGTSGAGPK
jgi:hypothetical protein